MAPTFDTGPASPERSLGQLVSDAASDLQTIVRSEVSLAKAEVSRDAKHAGKGVAMLAVAGVFALYFLNLALIAAAFGLDAAGLPTWAGFLIVAGVLLVITVILALVGKKAFTKMQGGPQKATRQAKLTAEALKPEKI